MFEQWAFEGEADSEIVLGRESMNMVSSSRVGGRRLLAAWGWGRVAEG